MFAKWSHELQERALVYLASYPGSLGAGEETGYEGYSLQSSSTESSTCGSSSSGPAAVDNFDSEQED